MNSRYLLGGKGKKGAVGRMIRTEVQKYECVICTNSLTLLMLEGRARVGNGDG